MPQPAVMGQRPDVQHQPVRDEADRTATDQDHRAHAVSEADSDAGWVASRNPDPCPRLARHPQRLHGPVVHQIRRAVTTNEHGNQQSRTPLKRHATAAVSALLHHATLRYYAAAWRGRQAPLSRRSVRSPEHGRPTVERRAETTGDEMTATKRALTLLAALLVTLSFVAAPTPASAAPRGKVQVTIVTPKGVPVSVVLKGKTRHTVAKRSTGTVRKVSLTVPAGTYHLQAPAITYKGRLYQPVKSAQRVQVRAGKAATVTARYRASVGARGLQATHVKTTSIGMRWTTPRGAKVVVRRTNGDVPAARRTAGVPVRVKGSTARDDRLKPGRTYSFAVFTKVGKKWVGPVTMTAGTASPPGSTDAAYIAPPTTLVVGPGDVVAAGGTGSGVQVALGPAVPPRVLGSAVVLPQSAQLPGGFLGVVTGLSADGRSVTLSPGGISDAFDYYSVSIPEISTAATAIGPAGGPDVAPGNDHVPDRSQRTPLPPEDTTRSPDEPSQAPPGTLAPSAAGFGCSDGAGRSIEFKPQISLSGRFKATISKKELLFVDVPTGASLDMALTATVTGTADIETTGSWDCGLDLEPTRLQLTATPIPLSFYFEPTVGFSVQGATDVEDVGMTVKAGVQLSGSLSLDGKASFSGSPILKATPHTPTISLNGSIGATVGGEVIVGPGAGTTSAGVIAGVGGHINPLEAGFGPTFTRHDSRFNTCLSAEAKATFGLRLTAKAWLGNWDISRNVTIDALQGSHSYGSWDLPSGCGSAPPPPPVEPGEDVIGDGVDLVDDVTTGHPWQWGHVDGFAPGQKTWVLSTGLVDEATGEPVQEASTDLGAPGDPTLSALAGHLTYDSAAYEVTVVPSGSTLHVKYVFASEEYPEYVGSRFNDVMAVFVDGVNCGYVPGSSDPVAVNGVNAQTNSQYFVDNAAGVSGYSTSMDGLTVPLTCSRPVTPGVPVTVRIAVSDTSDGVIDSAVALVDKGIWSD
ncbi:choice-of-anchor L domain-containing protein [Blastococcus sp. SYSU DS0617]